MLFNPLMYWVSVPGQSAMNGRYLEGEAFFWPGRHLRRIEVDEMERGRLFTVAVGTPHYVVTKDSSPVFELHVMGPWQMTYANPDDHPLTQDSVHLARGELGGRKKVAA